MEAHSLLKKYGRRRGIPMVWAAPRGSAWQRVSGACARVGALNVALVKSEPLFVSLAEWRLTDGRDPLYCQTDLEPRGSGS